MSERPTSSIEDICKLGGSLAFSIENALTLTVITRHGHEVAENVQFNVLRSHQEHLFLDGLKKIGLDEGASDPVRCAKYHVLSNYLGGLRVRYGEGDGKAWVVYDTPYWIDSPWSPGIAAAALRPEMLIRTMKAWHANNGVMLGNPRLGYVQATLVAAGGACDAGYFYEADHDLPPEERYQLKLEEGLPLDLELTPPDLDETAWPIERQAKAWRNFSVAYVGGRLYWLMQDLGEEETASLLEHATRITLLQNRERMQTAFGVTGDPSPARAAALWAGWHASWGDEVEVSEQSDGSVDAVVRRSRFHEAGEFTPPAEPLPASFEAAIDRAWTTVIEYDCPGVVATAQGSMLNPDDPWGMQFRERA